MRGDDLRHEAALALVDLMGGFSLQKNKEVINDNNNI
jgi:hypothetical protein